MGSTGFQTFGLIVAVLIANWVFGWGLRFWQRSQDTERRVIAERVLREHGMEAHTYLPSFGCEAGPLRDALTAFDFANKLVLDREGRLVGRALPKVQAKGPGIRLIVDNTK